jgi:hypothetical protein
MSCGERGKNRVLESSVEKIPYNDRFAHVVEGNEGIRPASVWILEMRPRQISFAFAVLFPGKVSSQDLPLPDPVFLLNVELP